MPRGDELLLEHLDASATKEDVILRLNEFFEGFFAVENSLTLEQWNAALPTQQEKVEMAQVSCEEDRLIVFYIYIYIYMHLHLYQMNFFLV